MRRYPITYEIENHPEGLTKEELNGRGACDAVIVCSILKDGKGFSVTFHSMDGEAGEPLDGFEHFKIWGAMAASLSRTEGLAEWMTDIAGHTHESIGRYLRGMRRIASQLENK